MIILCINPLRVGRETMHEYMFSQVQVLVAENCVVPRKYALWAKVFPMYFDGLSWLE